ncbi:fimbria/pilus outer membrane usher protein [Moraxella sp. VT-16-12]|uniref:fimbria/pilus outer membrane usher protein n=1 Tax=Moraxella sp. VT-16-12 TaxID=2014877 RepID=UPI000B7D1665|nr:fimbria/pilus outer membrane usher protein [Moraxella sp. VT-16-12]TWV80539.1 fimbrial biogenesis outer membrane usher protein [Moraxella sp. VT-16-12]
MKKQLLKQTLVLCVVSAMYGSVQADDGFEFNPAFLHGGVSIDPEAFRYGNPINAGEYLADIYVNDELRGQQLITFIKADGEPMRGLCLTDELINLIDVKADFKPKSPLTACMPAPDFHDDIKFRFDIGTHRLDISAPQAILMTYPKGYIPRTAWQQGEPMGFVKYHFNSYHYDVNNRSSEQSYLGVQTGLNFGGAWSFRQSGSTSWRDGKHGEYHHQNAYLQRDIDKWNGRLYVGDFNTQSTLLDNFAIRGVAINSDIRMLPNSQTGYAPRIQGVAKSNARVRVRQNDTIIHEMTVPAGLFVIDDLYALSSTSGDLVVEVLEADGTSSVSVVPFSSTSQMLRPNQLRYQVALGQYRRQDDVVDKPLLHGSMQYGLNNHVTMQAGVILHDNYWSNTLGGVWGSKYGAISADWTGVSATIANKRLNNNRFHVGYTKYFGTPKTYVNADWHHYFDQQNFSLSQTLSSSNTPITHSPRYSLKNQYRLSINQNLGKRGGLYVSGIYNDYWQGEQDYNYRLGYSSSVGRLQYQVGVARSYLVNHARHENMIYVNLNLPFYAANERGTSSISSNYQRTANRDYLSASYHRNFGDLNQYHYGLSATKTDDNKPSISANAGASLSMAQLNMSASRHDKDTQYSYGVSGAMVAHKHGITFNHELGDTFAVIHAKGAKGTPVVGGSGTKLDRFGNGVVSHLNPYRNNYIALDGAKLPDNVEIAETGRGFVPRANTANLVTFDTKSGQLVLFDIDFKANTAPALTEAVDEMGNVVGHMTHDGRLLARLATQKGAITLKWANDSCVFDYQVNDTQDLVVQAVKCQ